MLHFLGARASCWYCEMFLLFLRSLLFYVLLSVCCTTGVRFVFLFCVFSPCFHLHVASLHMSFADRIEHSLVLICGTRFLPFLSYAHSFYIFTYTC